MAEAFLTFPKNFLWGTATAAHQVEGGNHNNNWWAWEQGGRVHPGHSAERACEWWDGRWREDFDRASEGGQTAHRFSVEWSRIQPGSDRWDPAALDQYRQMAVALRDRGMEPVVSLHHFSDPLWLAESRGWMEDRAQVFSAYTEQVVNALKDQVKIWVTLNEPNVYSTLGYVLGLFPPGRKNPLAAFQVMANLVRAHAAAYHTIHRLQAQAQVSMAFHFRGFQPARAGSPLDRSAARTQSRLFNDFFPTAASRGVLIYPGLRRRLRAAASTLDYFGLNYYTEELVAFSLAAAAQFFGRRFFRPGALLSETRFTANEPGGFFRALKWASGYNLPIMVTENGIDDSNDQIRRRYLAEHIQQLWRAVNFNWGIQGYFHWTLVDNFEWERGWTQRYGLWALDVETQERQARPSADLYAEICRANGLSSEMVARYAPESFAGMFPNE